MNMPRTRRGFMYFLEEENLCSRDKEIAFENAFRRYKNFYLPRPEQMVDQPGYKEFSSCAFRNPIEQEATDVLSHVLKRETLTNIKISADRQSELQKHYSANHLFLRAVRTFYRARLVKPHTGFKDLVSDNQISLKQGVPLSTSLQNEYQQLTQQERNQPNSYQYMDFRHLNLSLDQVPHLWPADMIDQNFFLERAGIVMPDLDFTREGSYAHIRPYIQEVASEVELLAPLEVYKDAAFIKKPQQKELKTQIIQTYRRQQEAEGRIQIPNQEIHRRSSQEILPSSSQEILPSSRSSSISIPPQPRCGCGSISMAPTWNSDSFVFLILFICSLVIAFFQKKSRNRKNIDSLREFKKYQLPSQMTPQPSALRPFSNIHSVENVVGISDEI